MSEKSVRKLKRFPKELKRDFWRATDWRFLYILLFSFLATGVTIVWMVQNFPRTDSDFVIEIQNRYVNRLLENADARMVERPTATVSARSAAEWANLLYHETLNPDAVQPTLPSGGARDQSLIPTPQNFEDRRKARESDAERRKKGRDDERDEIEKVGLLGLLTSRRDSQNPKSVTDILNFADSTSLDLKKKLEGLTSLEVPRPGKDFHGRGLGKDRNIYLAERSAKPNTRIRETKAKPEKFVSSLAKTPKHTVAKNSEFKRISEEPTGGALSGLKRKVRRRYARRTTKHIKDAVVGHNTAIQDCYRIGLKEDDQFKGKVTVRVTVDIWGRVSFAEIVRSTLNNKDLKDDLEYCIINKIRKWNDFGEVPESEGELTFTHVYVFGKD